MIRPRANPSGHLSQAGPIWPSVQTHLLGDVQWPYWAMKTQNTVTCSCKQGLSKNTPVKQLTTQPWEQTGSLHLFPLHPAAQYSHRVPYSKWHSVMRNVTKSPSSVSDAEARLTIWWLLHLHWLGPTHCWPLHPPLQIWRGQLTCQSQPTGDWHFTPPHPEMQLSQEVPSICEFSTLHNIECK